MGEKEENPMNTLMNSLVAFVNSLVKLLGLTDTNPLLNLTDALLGRFLAKEPASALICRWQCGRCFYNYYYGRWYKYCRRCCWYFIFGWRCGSYRLYYC
jgi:hypothetical protein